MEDIILGCLDCNKLFCQTSYDSYPVYEFDAQSKSFQEKETDDKESFIKAHESHKIVELYAIKDSLCSHYPYWEPIREDYMLFTDGNNYYTVKRWRKDINEPLNYEIVNYKIQFTEPVLQVQSKDLRRQMLADIKRLKLDRNKVEEFIERYEDFVSKISLNDVLECGFSSDDPMVTYASLKDEIMESFLKTCHSYFTDDGINILRKYLRENSEYDDVMNIIIKRNFKLIKNNNYDNYNPSSIINSMN